MAQDSTTVMVFGVFDGIHDGHRYFLRSAREHGTQLVAVVAPDEAVKAIKGKAPTHSLSERIENLQREDVADTVLPGDETPGTWSAIRQRQPDIIALGYDQRGLHRALEEVDLGYTPRLVRIMPHKPEENHSRFHKQNNGNIRVSGEIRRGKGEAATLGFPTINIPLEEPLESGIFSGTVYLHSSEYAAALYIPPSGDMVEAHLLAFNDEGDLYGEHAVVEIQDKIREAVEPGSPDEMTALIAQDVETIRAHYS